MLGVFSLLQLGGLWLIYQDVTYSISHIDPETMQIPKVIHTPLQTFIYGSSVSMASGFGALVLGAAWKMRRPYKNKSQFFLYLGFILQIVFIILGYVTSYIHKKPYLSIENIGLTSTLLWTIPVVWAACNKVVRAWSVELILKGPELPAGSYQNESLDSMSGYEQELINIKAEPLTIKDNEEGNYNI